MRFDSTVVERFWANIDMAGPVPAHCPELGPCWIWIGETFPNGYGDFGKWGEKHLLAHRVGYEIQVGPIPEGLMALHKCDVRPCARGSHLFTGTQQDNIDDMMRKGRGASAYDKGKNPPRGEKAGNAKLTAAKVLEIRDLYATGRYSHSELAARFGVGPMTINKIVRGARWAHIVDGAVCANPEAKHERLSAGVRGERHGMVKLTEAQVLEIRAKLAEGQSQKSLAAEYGVTPSAISYIATRHSWSHI